MTTQTLCPVGGVELGAVFLQRLTIPWLGLSGGWFVEVAQLRQSVTGDIWLRVERPGYRSRWVSHDLAYLTVLLPLHPIS